jgi:CubicO group peptidase (beta-lactamase class C family)
MGRHRDSPSATSLPATPPAGQPITIRHLASHTSGIPDEVGPVTSVEETVAAAARLPLAYAPGAQVTRASPSPS